jgi:L-lactate utilization protein LutB
MNQAPTEIRNEKLLTTVSKSLKSRHFDVYIAKNKEEALNIAMDLIPSDATVGWGGSATVDQIGIKDALKKRQNPVIDRSLAKSPEESKKLMKACLTCNTFLMSANAVSADGVLVNIDGNGNRVAPLIFGPDSVIVFVGINKIAPDVEGALKRARFVAAPTNAQRFDINTPCKIGGTCANCKSPDSICCNVNFTRICRPKGRIKVILINEELGF